jgi:hypothetical protein
MKEPAVSVTRHDAFYASKVNDPNWKPCDYNDDYKVGNCFANAWSSLYPRQETADVIDASRHPSTEGILDPDHYCSPDIVRFLRPQMGGL